VSRFQALFGHIDFVHELCRMLMLFVVLVMFYEVLPLGCRCSDKDSLHFQQLDQLYYTFLEVAFGIADI
jgi:hypothetical protein